LKEGERHTERRKERMENKIESKGERGRVIEGRGRGRKKGSKG
jgi:hypothetical protein